MAATVVVAERNGPLASSTEMIDVLNVNFGSVDAAALVPASAPITAVANGHSYEKWLRFYVIGMGGSTVLDNMKVWLSDLGGGYKTGEGVSCNLKTSGYSSSAYQTGGPVATDSSFADQVMPVAEPGGANLGISGSLAGSITAAPAYSDYIVLQLDVSASTPAGAVNTKVVTFQWDEQ